MKKLKTYLAITAVFAMSALTPTHAVDLLTGSVDLTDVTDTILGIITAVTAVALTIMSVLGAIKAYKLLRGAMA